MEFLKAQLARISELLSGLSASQKMLTGCLTVIMVMTLVWWSYWAAEPEMEPVLNQSLSQEDIGVIVATLDSKSIPHKVVGDKVMVAADRKIEALAELGYSQALPRDTKTGFDDLIKQSNWLDSPEKTDKIFMEATQRTLSMVIRNFPGVSDAVVMIDPTNDRRFDGSAVEPSAMVTITTGRGAHANAKQLAESAADVVSGAEAGLALNRIKIVIDGVPVDVPDASENGMGGGDEIVDSLKTNETFYTGKIRDLFGDISGLMVSVHCELSTARTETHSHKVDPKGTVSVLTKSEEQTSESTAAPAAGQEPGAQPNIGVAIGPSSGGAGNSTSSDTSKNEFTTDTDKEDTVTVQGPGTAKVVSASVRVPRSYFVQDFKTKNGKDPDDAALGPFIDDELKQIRSDVKGCTGLGSDDSVIVEAYSDIAPPAMTTPVASVSPVTQMLGNHSKEIAVGVLAAASLFMVSSMVRKGGGGAPVVALANEKSGPTMLRTDDALAGEVGEGGAMLDGIELDEESVKTQQMIDQVQEMVQSDPDGAANLVKRWLSHT